MRVKKYTIEEDGFDLKKELSIRRISCREFSKIVGIHFVSLYNIINGLPASEEKASKIKECLELRPISDK